jgi:hypothetical protein
VLRLLSCLSLPESNTPLFRCTASSAKEVKFECATPRSKAISDESSDKGDKSSDEGDKSNGGNAVEEEPTSRGISLTPDESIRDKIKYKIRTAKEGIRVKIEYEQEVDTVDGRSETGTEFELVFDRLIEYTKGVQGTSESSNGGDLVSEAYDWEADEVVQTIGLERWSDITQISNDANQNVSFFTATTSLPSELGATAAGTILFNFTISQADQSEQITANTMKIDVRILNFPWARQDSYVALTSTVESKKKVKLDYNRDATVGKEKAHVTQDVFVSFTDGMAETGISAFGQYTWASEAQVTSDSFNGIVNENVMSSRQANPPAEIDEDAVEEPVIWAGEPEQPIPELEMVEDTSDEFSVNGTLIATKPTEEVVDGTKGSTIQVIATSQADNETDNFQNIAYSFVGRGAHSASDIYWDPQAGIGYEEPESGASHGLSYSIGLVATSLMGAMLCIL